MSTSPSRSQIADPSHAERIRPQPQPFPYDAITKDGNALPSKTESGADGLRNRETDATSAREIQARAQGRQEGLGDGNAAFAEQLARERAAIVAAVHDFGRERTTYYRKVEGEIVQLALSIARKILHRESQIDPLLLAGIVRVALDKIEGATGVLLRVHPQNVAEWRRYFSLHMEAAEAPEILEDASLQVDRCILETSMGTAVLGVEVQLKEIELGLMDLLSARPGPAS